MGIVKQYDLFLTALLGLLLGLIALALVRWGGPTELAIGLGGASAGIIATVFAVWFVLWTPMRQHHGM